MSRWARTRSSTACRLHAATPTRARMTSVVAAKIFEAKRIPVLAIRSSGRQGARRETSKPRASIPLREIRGLASIYVEKVSQERQPLPEMGSPSPTYNEVGHDH